MEEAATVIEFPNMLNLIDFSLIMTVEPLPNRAKLTLTAPFSHEGLAIAILEFKGKVLTITK